MSEREKEERERERESISKITCESQMEQVYYLQLMCFIRNSYHLELFLDKHFIYYINTKYIKRQQKLFSQ